MSDPQNHLPADVTNSTAAAQARAEATGQPCYVVRNPTTKQCHLIPAGEYYPTNRRRIIEFIAFADKRSI